jgi:hypothetical protein
MDIGSCLVHIHYHECVGIAAVVYEGVMLAHTLQSTKHSTATESVCEHHSFVPHCLSVSININVILQRVA